MNLSYLSSINPPIDLTDKKLASIYRFAVLLRLLFTDSAQALESFTQVAELDVW